MGLSPETERALDMCYDAIATPQLWTAALDNLVHSPGDHACKVLPHAISQRPFGVGSSSQALENRRAVASKPGFSEESTEPHPPFGGMRNFRKSRNFVLRAIVN